MASSADAPSAGSMYATGTFTSASTAAAEVITIGFNPTMVAFVLNANATNPDLVISRNGITDSYDLDGGATQALATSPTNVVTYNGDGTITLAAAAQEDDAVNYWVAFR